MWHIKSCILPVDYKVHQSIRYIFTYRVLVLHKLALHKLYTGIIRLYIDSVLDLACVQKTYWEHVCSTIKINSVKQVLPTGMYSTVIIIIISNLFYNLAKWIKSVPRTQYKMTCYSSFYIYYSSLFNGNDCSD